jgi:hypothetical protein
MPKVECEREYKVDADEMWSTIGDFTSLDKWSSGIESVDLSDGGKTRKLNLPGGLAITEHLLSEGEKSYTYSLDPGGPLPVVDYTSTISVREAGDGSCVVKWDAEFAAADGTPEEQAVQIINMVYTNGLETIAKKFAP